MDTQMKYFRLKNKRSGWFLDVYGASESSGTDGNVVQEYDHPGDQQRWLVAPIPGDRPYYHIVAKHSGMFLDVWGGSTKAGPDGNVVQYELPGEQNKWALIPVSDRWYKIQNKKSGLFLDVWESSGSAVQYDDHAGDSNKWALIPENIPMPEDLRKLGPLPKVRPRLEEPFEPLPRGETYVVDRRFVPCFAVKDPNYDSKWKATNSPYYILETQQTYISKPEWFLSNTGSEPMTVEFAYTSGWSEAKSKEFTTTTSITVSASASYGPVEASVEATHETSTTEGSESQRSGEQTKTVQKTVGANKAVAGWAIETEFILKRLDERIVKSWSVEGGHFHDDFPDEAVATTPKRLLPFLVALEKELDGSSGGNWDPERAKALAQLARAATAIVESREPD